MLEDILKNKKEEILSLKQNQSSMVNDLERMRTKKRGFLKKIKEKIKKRETAIIAEIKRHSPSRGYLDKNLNLKIITEEYESAGATCISVLTEKKYFKGSIEDLISVKEYTILPILRKDFIIDESQIIESKYIGADCILLIVAALSEEKLKALYSLSKELDLDVLVEVHDENELNMALRNNCELIGINNRNLKTFDVSIQNSLNLCNLVVNPNITLVSESGIMNKKDIEILKASGINVFLIGEKLITSNDREKEIMKLIG